MGIAPYLIPSGASRSAKEPDDAIVVLAEDSEVSAEIVASGVTAYWVDRGFSNADSIRAVPLDGGVATTVYTCPDDRVSTVPSLALDSMYLYWAESPLSEHQMSLVKRIPLDGGPIEPVLATRGRIRQIFVDPPFLYTIDEGSVRATQLADRSQTTLGTVPASAEAGAMTADHGAAYWLGAAVASTKAIMTTSGPGFQPMSLATRDAVIPAMSATGRSLYWIERGGLSDGASLFVMGRAGGTPVRVFESSRMSASASYGHAILAADADGAYWMVDPSGPVNDGALYQGGVGGLEPQILVSGIERPGGVAVSGGWLVFTDMGTGFVVRISK
jgi:hypothetical protein